MFRQWLFYFAIQLLGEPGKQNSCTCQVQCLTQLRHAVNLKYHAYKVGLHPFDSIVPWDIEHWVYHPFLSILGYTFIRIFIWNQSVWQQFRGWLRRGYSLESHKFFKGGRGILSWINQCVALLKSFFCTLEQELPWLNAWLPNLRSVMSIFEDKNNQVCLPFHKELLANPKLISVFSLILSMTGNINFQTGKVILLQVEFSRIPINFKQ